MQHSIPDFPNYVSDGYEYGSSQEKYGQAASCFSYDVATFDTIAYAMRYSGPWIYDTNMDATTTTGNLSALLNEDTFYLDPAHVNLLVRTKGNLEVVLLGKTGAYGADMIDKVVVPALGGPSMYSQSWLNSCTKVGSYCETNGTEVVDVLESHYGVDTVAWSTVDDHAKWAVGSDSESTWACIVDNNRCTSQYKRGGLVQCFENNEFHAVLIEGTQEVDTCGGGDDTIALDDDVSCCHYDDATCSAGDVCCLSSCYDPSTCSYTESGCSGEYGQIHDCTWTDDGICVVSSSA